MNRFVVKWQDQDYKLALASTQEGYAVQLNEGPPQSVNIRLLDDKTLSLQAGQKSHLVRIDDSNPDMWVVTVDGTEYRLSVWEQQRFNRLRIKEGGSMQGSQARVLSPMPGKILRLMVNVGDVVIQGQSLLVVEAMKMENELQSKAAGQVMAIHVAIGDAVSTGALLVEIA